MKIINFGSLNIDYTFHVEHIAKPGQTISSCKEAQYPGGKGLNQSIAIARAGMPCYHAGLIGKDGRYLRELLENNLVDCRFVKEIHTGTGKAFIQVDREGQNCIVISSGANNKNSRELCEEVLSHFDKGDILLLQNEINMIDYLIEKASEKEMIVALNPSPMNEKIAACDLSKVSIFILNEDEGLKLSGSKREDAVLYDLHHKYPKAEIMLTLGARGSKYISDREEISQEAISVESVDSTGAGDTFTGYFLAGIAKGMSRRACISLAARAAAISVTKHGASSSIPYLEEVVGGAYHG